MRETQFLPHKERKTYTFPVMAGRSTLWGQERDINYSERNQNRRSLGSNTADLSLITNVCESVCVSNAVCVYLSWVGV